MTDYKSENKKEQRFNSLFFGKDKLSSNASLPSHKTQDELPLDNVQE